MTFVSIWFLKMALQSVWRWEGRQIAGKILPSFGGNHWRLCQHSTLNIRTTWGVGVHHQSRILGLIQLKRCTACKLFYHLVIIWNPFTLTYNLTFIYSKLNVLPILYLWIWFVWTWPITIWRPNLKFQTTVYPWRFVCIWIGFRKK